MKLFGRNDAEINRGASEEAISHRLTLDLSKAEALATMMANSRGSRVVEVVDLLAGMYIYSWERLCRYWQDKDQEGIEALFRKICRISPERWNYWIQFYDKQRRNSTQRLSSLPLIRFKKLATSEPPRRSAELILLLKKAEEISPFRDTSSERDIPILTSECILLCIVRNGRSEISRKLAASGMNVPQLEKDALSTRRAPRQD